MSNYRTPGPWKWNVNLRTGHTELVSFRGGKPVVVMAFGLVHIGKEVVIQPMFSRNRGDTSEGVPAPAQQFASVRDTSNIGRILHADAHCIEGSGTMFQKLLRIRNLANVHADLCKEELQARLVEIYLAAQNGIWTAEGRG